MFKNYFKIAYRNLLRHKGYAVINVCGLALGIACCLLIGLYVQDELSFDRFHERGERIYRVNQHVTRADVGDETWAWTGGGLGEDLERDFAQVEAVVRFTRRAGIVRYEREGAGDVRSFREEDVLFTDPEVFDVFSFPLVRGNPETALQDPGSIVVTRSMAAKYFGEEDPIGETLEYDGRPYTVTAIAADVPPNSHLRFEFLLPMSAFKVINSFPVEAGFGSYWWPYMWTYVLLPNEETAKALQAQMPTFSERHRTDGDAFVPTLEPLHAIHLQSAAEPGTEPDVPGAGGDLATVQTFALIALAVLLLACINFMNLSTARSAKRAKEVGVRKTVGAGRPQLVGQFLGESVLLSLLALVLAVGLVELLLPLFNLLAGREISVGYAENGAYWLGLVGLVGVTGLAAGAYPALYLSGFRPARVLKGAISTSRGGDARFRKGLVVFQFAVSIALVAGTAVAFLQLRYMQNARLGFDQEAVITVRLQGDAAWETLEREWEAQTSVQEVVSASPPPGIGEGTVLPYKVGAFEAEDADPASISHIHVDDGYFEMMDVEVLAGRPFGPAFPADEGYRPDSTNFYHIYDRAFVLNEAAARHNGWTPEEALGQELRLYAYENGTYFTDLRGTVVGVVADVHQSSLHEAIRPAAYSWAETPLGHRGAWALVKVAPGGARAAMATVRDVWDRVVPGAPFEAFFLDDELRSLYAREARLGKIIGAFALVGLVIACLGLLGLAAYAAEQRTKEIGVRKVMGASVTSVVALLSKDFLGLVLAAALVAAPVTFLVMDRWLDGFAYRIDVSPLLLVGVALAALLVAFATVGYHALRAATADPVESLRYE